jgi:excisionase family DNA binding protein
MTGQGVVLDSVVAAEGELDSLEQMDQLLRPEHSQTKFVGPDNETILVPESVYHLLRKIIPLLRAGKAVSFMPQEHELTTQQAAALLNVSRPFLIKLLEQGQIPHHLSGTHRRIYVNDLLTYKQQRDQQCHAALDELTQMSQDLGFYSSEAFTESIRENGHD